MKPHLIVRLRPGAGPAAVAAWHESIDDKAGATESLTAAVDAVLRRHHIHGWVTQEFAPAAPDRRWSADEVVSGLNRVFRIVLRDDPAIPRALVDDDFVLPEVEYVRIGRVGVAPLPVSRAQSAAGVGWAREIVGLSEAHRWTRGSAEATIAVLDTGVDTGTVEPKAAVRPGFDFVDIVDGAGVFFADHLDADDYLADPSATATMSRASLRAKVSPRPVGVAPGCALLPVQVLGAMRQEGRPVGAGLVDNINTALKWVIDQGADVVNMSFGLPHTVRAAASEDRGVRAPARRRPGPRRGRCRRRERMILVAARRDRRRRHRPGGPGGALLDLRTAGPVTAPG